MGTKTSCFIWKSAQFSNPVTISSVCVCMCICNQRSWVFVSVSHRAWVIQSQCLIISWVVSRLGADRKARCFPGGVANVGMRCCWKMLLTRWLHSNLFTSLWCSLALDGSEQRNNNCFFLCMCVNAHKTRDACSLKDLKTQVIFLHFKLVCAFTVCSHYTHVWSELWAITLQGQRCYPVKQEQSYL